MSDCLEIGVIQAFLDGELSHDETGRVSQHIAACEPCSALLSEAEDESAFVFPVIARELDVLVPTQRLWNRINDEIATAQRGRSFLDKIRDQLSSILASPSVLAAASLLLVFGIITVLWLDKNLAPAPTPVSLAASQRREPAVPRATSESLPTTVQNGDDAATVQPSVRAERTSFHVTSEHSHPVTAAVVPNNAVSPVSAAYLPGEDSYVKTISTLAKTVDTQKDDVLRPGERVAFERDLAVINDTIVKMKAEVKRNPKNEPAKQVLYTSYQNKIDLLNSVAQKEELVASLR